MMSNMRKSGFDKEAMMQVFKERKAKLNQALEEYQKKESLYLSIQHVIKNFNTKPLPGFEEQKLFN